MTSQQSFKRRIRARMEKTGESYTARAQLLPDPEPQYEPRFSDAVVRRNTGHGYGELFAALDEWGAAERPHAEIARWLGDKYGIPGWWCQNVTVEYERARGLRPVGGDRDGTLNASASKTVAVPVERLFEAFAGRWPELHRRTEQPPRSARFDWEDGATRVAATFTAKGEAKSTVAVSHERIADGETAARLKKMWRERLTELKAALER